MLQQVNFISHEKSHKQKKLEDVKWLKWYFSEWKKEKKSRWPKMDSIIKQVWLLSNNKITFAEVNPREDYDYVVDFYFSFGEFFKKKPNYNIESYTKIIKMYEKHINNLPDYDWQYK